MNWPDALRQLSLLSLVSEDCSEKFSELGIGIENSVSQEIVSFGEEAFPEWSNMGLALSSEGVKETAEKFKLSKSYICIAPGSVWETKKWTVEGFTDVAKAYTKKSIQVVLVGSPSEKESCITEF